MLTPLVAALRRPIGPRGRPPQRRPPLRRPRPYRGRGPVRGFFHRNSTDLRHGFGALLLSSGGDLVAGVALGSMTHTLERLPGLLILVPAAIGMRGNIFGVLGARLGTAIHIGRFRDPLSANSPAGQSVAAAGLLTVYISIALGALAWIVARILAIPHIGIAEFVTISVLGGIGSSVVVLGVTLAVAATSVRRGWDLDNVSAPVVTATGDLVTLPALWAASFAVHGHLVAEIIGLSCLALLAVSALWQLRHRALATLQQIVRQSVPLLVLAGLVDVLAGYTLEAHTARFFMLPALLVLVPPFLEDAGALGGMLSARLSSKLHLGVIEPRRWPGRRGLEDMAVIGVLAVPVFALVAISSTLVSMALGLSHPGMGTMIGLSLLAGLFATVGAIVIAYYAGTTAFRLGLDPDNYGIPIITSSTDLIGTVSLVAAILLIGLV